MTSTATILQARRFNPDIDPGTEPVILRIEGKNIGSLQNFIGLTGLPKNGKGKYAAGIVASGLSRNEVFGIRCKLPESRPRIAWFSTDESRYDLFKTVSIIKKLSGTNCENLDVYNVRQDDSKNIIDMLQHYSSTYKDCALIVIDNIADLLINYNDEGQSKRTINLLKQWSDINNSLIIAVLHLGKGNNTTLGHLGAGMDRYAQSVLRVTKDKEHNVYTLTGEMLRSAPDFSPIDITYDPGTDEWKQTYHVDESKTKLKPIIARPSELDKIVHLENLQQIFKSKAVLKWDLLLSNMKLIYSRGGQWCKECVTHLIKEDLIINTDDGFTMPQKGQSTLFIQK